MTKIEWTEETWNPVVGCSLASPGCTNCYAMAGAYRLLDKAGSHYEGTTQRVNGRPVWTGKIALAPDHILFAPSKRKRPTMWFVNSMGDLFHEDVPVEWIDRVFAVMALNYQHTFQVLTKRSRRMREYLSDARTRIYVECEKIAGFGKIGTGRWPLDNVWLGVSAEDQCRADERIPDLLATGAAVRFVSCEPLIGPVNLRSLSISTNIDLDTMTGSHSGIVETTFDDLLKRGIPTTLTLPKRLPALDWIIVGGESGPRARPMALGWAKDIVRQCTSASVPVFVKQVGAYPTNREGERCPNINHPKGANPNEWPEELRVRQFPNITAEQAA